MRTTSLACFAALMLACASEAPGDKAPAGAESSSSAEALVFAEAAAAQELPRDLLVAIAVTEGGLGMPAERDVAEEVEVPAAGPLMLRRGRLDTLALGAQLSGKSEWELRRNTDLGLRAGAQVLAKLARDSGARNDSLPSFMQAVKELSGYADELHREEYAHRVFALLARGGSFVGRDGGSIVLNAHEVPPTMIFDMSESLHKLAGAEYPNTDYFPIPAAKQADKLTVGRGGAKVQYVVIHDTEGGWDGSVATLQNDPGKSVQYIIDVNGRLGQFMSEADTAYHVGNFHYNQRSVGIEHVGYSTRPYPTKQYVASANLVKHLAIKYTVALDRAHIIGHDQVPNGKRIAADSPPCAMSPKACTSTSNYGGAGGHSDPGVWEWARLLYLTGSEAKVNDVTPIWNCSSDLLFAFRSAAGKVQVQECASCTVKPIGTDDECVPKATPPAPTSTGATPPPAPAPSGTAPNTPPPAAATPTPPSASGCCAVGPARDDAQGKYSGLAAVAVLGLGAAVRARRRKPVR